MKKRPRLFSSALLIAAVGACSSSTGPFANLSANNNPDDFIFIAQTFGHSATTTLNYTWQHNSPVAQINQQMAVPGAVTLATLTGTGNIEVKDMAGKVVWTHDLKESLQDTTVTGAPGNWTVNLSFVNVNGDIIFELKRAPRDLIVTTTTTGGTGVILDDAYTLTLDGTATQSVSGTAQATFSNLSPASHTVVISGVAANCTVTDGTSRSATVPATNPVTVSFAITCI
jgi:hypothetical protein